MVFLKDDARTISDLVADQADEVQKRRKTGGKKEAKVRDAVIVVKDYLQRHGGRADSAETLAAVINFGFYKKVVYEAVQALGITSEKREGKKRDWVLPAAQQPAEDLAR